MYRIELITSFSPYSTTPIYTEQTQDNLPVSNAHFTTEINEGGNLEFTLVSGHPYYSLLEPLVSYISLLDDGGEVLYGRVYDRSDPTLTGQITYQVEGALSFLQDSEVEPESKDADGNYNVRTLTAEQFFRWCIAQHNADTADPRRRFAVGVITASRKNETNEYQITSYTETKSAIQQYILDQYGGMLRIRKGEGAIHYIDWVQDYGVVNSQPIELGTNVEDQTNAMTADGVFTVLRPVGANGLTLARKTVNVYPQEQINRMGRIVKSVVFQDADTEEKLLAKANSYIARIEKKLDKETSVKLVDFHFLNSAVKKIRMGDMFTNIYGFEDDTLTVYSVDQDILHIEDGQYTLKNKKELGTITDGRVKGGTISKSSARGARAGGLALKYYHEATDEATLEVKKLHIIADDMDMHLNTLDLDVKETADIAAKTWNLATENYESISHVENTLDQYREDTDSQIYGLNIRVRDVEGSGVIQNSDHITTVSGKFEIWEDPQTGKETVHLTDGAEMAVDGLNGSIITVGGLNDKARDAENAIARHTIEIDGVQGVVSEMTGSALWTQREKITGVTGEFDVIELPDPEHPGHYIKHLKIVSGGGMTIERDNVEYGLYDNGNLTGGLIVQKINNQTSAQIKGDLIKIGELSNEDLDTWAAEAKAGTGVFAKFLTVKQLRADEIETLLANIGDAWISKLNVTNDMRVGSVTVSGSEKILNDLEVSNCIFGDFYYGNADSHEQMQVIDAWKSNDGKTLYIKKTDGTTVTFNRATLLEGEWSGGTYTVTGSPAGILTPISTTLMDLENNGAVGKSGKRVYQNIKAMWGYPDDTQYRFTGFAKNVYIDATAVYNDGWNDATDKNSIPTSHSTGNTRVMGWPSPDTVGGLVTQSYTLAEDGVNAVKLYTNVDGQQVTVARLEHGEYDAAMGQFELADITLQGAAYGSITPISGTYKYDQVVLYQAGTAATYYYGDGASVVGRGDAVTITPIGSAHKYSYATVYDAGSAVTYYQGNGSGVYGRGTSVSITPIGTAHKFSYATVYDAGTAVTYYQGNGGTKYARGDTVSAREVLSSGGTTYYSASSTKITAIGTKYYYQQHAKTVKPTAAWYSEHTSDPGSGTRHIRYAAGTQYTIQGSSEIHLGSSSTFYKGNGGSFVARGDTVTVTPIGTAHQYLKSDSSGGVTYYDAGSAGTYYYGDGGYVVGRGDTVSITPIGTAHQYLKSDSSGNVTYYDAGSAGTYYKGNGASVTGRGNAVTVTPIGAQKVALVVNSSGSVVRYGAGDPITNLRKPGTRYTDTYYTKK